MSRFIDPFGKQISRRDMLRIISATASAAALSSCTTPGGIDPPDDEDGELPLAPGTSVPGAGTQGTPISDVQRMAALSAVDDKVEELHDPLSGKVSTPRLLDWLRRQSAFHTVGFSRTRDAYAIFTDGRALLIQVDSRISSEGVTKISPSIPGAPVNISAQIASLRAATLSRATNSREKLPRVAAAAGDVEAGLPGKFFRFINCWSTSGEDFRPIDTWCWPNVINPHDVPMMAEKMELFGYQVVFGADGLRSRGPSCRVENLRNITGDGVFYWGTHGGELLDDGTFVQALLTSTIVDEDNDRLNKDDLDAKRLIYMRGLLCPMGCSMGESYRGNRYAITANWIRHYNWRFGDYSLVFINACSSGTGDLKEAFLEAGASVYLGWNKPVRFWAVCGSVVDFFSLMLGINENNGGTSNLVTPRQRPYDWGEVLFHLQARTMMAGYYDPEESFVQLEATPNPAVPQTFLCLRPSMYWNTFDEAESELHLIGGMFGTDRGTAAIGTDVEPAPQGVNFGNLADYRITGATPLAIRDWQSQNVVLKVPLTGPGSAGLVQVEHDGRFSNVAQLTRLNFPIQLVQHHGGTLKVDVSVDMQIRGDFRGVRISPVQDLTYFPFVNVRSPAATTGTFFASGSYTYNDGDSVVHVQWSGLGQIETVGVAGAILVGVVFPSTRIGSFSVRVGGSGITEKVTVTSPGEAPVVSERLRSFEIRSEPGQTFPAHSISVPFNSAYARPQVVLQDYGVPESSNYNNQAVVTHIELGPCTADYPPSDDKGGR